MAREYQSMRDRNILNSWDKGGKFEGKQVTDQMLLSHLKARRDGLSPDDPMYDEAGQRLTEYTFAVDNSKKELDYAEGKASDGDMARFYANAATKLSVNSEAWRNMRTLAAQYKDRAAKGSGGGGGGGGGRGGRYNSEENNIPQRKELAYDSMMDLLTDVARKEGILDTKTETLSDLRVAQGDATRLVQLLNILNTDPKYATARGLVTAHIKKWGNPNFNGQFTWDALQREKVNKNTGITSRITKAQKGGHATDVKKLTEQAGKVDEAFIAITAAGPRAAYEDARRLFDVETEDPDATPITRYLATQKYVAKLSAIHANTSELAGATRDTRTQLMEGHLKNEIESFSGGGNINAPTLWEDSRGVVAGYKPEGGEAAQNVEDYNHLRDQMRNLASGEGVLVKVDENGQPTDHPDGVYDVVKLSAVEGGAAWVPTGGGIPKAIDFEGTTIDLSGTLTAILPTPVYTEAQGAPDITGRPTASAAVPAANQNIANMFIMPDGTELAQYWDSAGTVRWTNDPGSLFVGADGVTNITPEQGRNGLQITVTPASGKAKTYDPFDAINSQFRDPAAADDMVNKVGRSSFAVWMNSARSATSDPGVAYAMDPTVMAAAIAREIGQGKPSELVAALDEAERSRTDYLAKTPDIDRRIRAAAEKGRTGTVADKLVAEGFADMGGLERDVKGFYERLWAKKDPSEMDSQDRRTAGVGEEAARDELIRAALMEDGNERQRILGIERGEGILPSHVRDLMSQNQAKGVMGPHDLQRATGQAGVVAAFQSATQANLAGVAGALGAFGVPGGAGTFGPGLPSGPPIVTPPKPPPKPPTPPPPRTPPPTPTAPLPPSYAGDRGGGEGRGVIPSPPPTPTYEESKDYTRAGSR
jgi:hypothetical protein